MSIPSADGSWRISIQLRDKLLARQRHQAWPASEEDLMRWVCICYMLLYNLAFAAPWKCDAKLVHPDSLQSCNPLWKTTRPVKQTLNTMCIHRLKPYNLNRNYPSIYLSNASHLPVYRCIYLCIHTYRTCMCVHIVQSYVCVYIYIFSYICIYTYM